LVEPVYKIEHNTACTPLDVVDFNKSCEEARGKFLQLSGIAVYYYHCDHCGFCFAPEFNQWTLKDFSDKIYNDEYIAIDPDYQEIRPKSNKAVIINFFESNKEHIQHLDWGGGNGLLSQLLQETNWNSLSYDPFFNKETEIKTLGQFNLITAFEVFEHVPDVHQLMLQLDILLKKNGIVLFSTLLSDNKINKNRRLDWWYAAPRNGHISLFSKESLIILAQKYHFNFGSFSSGLHLFFREIPNWAKHLFKVV
jgi:SAM-dependent methyltransferase